MKVERLPDRAELDRETGRLAWPLEVAPGQKARASITFLISAPRGMSVRPPELI